MGLTLVNLSGAQRGVEADETGINVNSFNVEYAPQFKDYLNNYQGQRLGFAIPDKMTRTITLSGEVTGNTGVMAANCNTAQTFANDVADFVAISGGSSAGGAYLDRASVSQSRDGWRSVDQTYTIDPLIT